MVSVFLVLLRYSMSLTEHVFYNHQLKVTQFTSYSMANKSLVWPSVLFFILLILIIVVKNSALNNVLKIFKSTTNNQAWQQYLREDGTNIKSHNLVLVGIYLLTLTYFVYKINTYYNLVFVSFSSLWQYLFLLGVFLLCLLLKFMANFFIARITNSLEVISNYQTYTLLINQAFGVIYFPMFVLIEFAGFNSFHLLTVCLSLYLLSILVKWIKGSIICITEYRIGILQTFLYLCALELLPFLVIVKFSVETF